jgi:hypothetical protein
MSGHPQTPLRRPDGTPMQSTTGKPRETRTESFDSLRTYEFIECTELASRWNLPESWVREQTRGRSADPIPHVRFGKYVRLRWGSPELENWAARRIVSSCNRVVGRALGKESK